MAWPRLSLWRLSIPQPAICVRRPPNTNNNTTATLHMLRYSGGEVSQEEGYSGRTTRRRRKAARPRRPPAPRRPAANRPQMVLFRPILRSKITHLNRGKYEKTQKKTGGKNARKTRKNAKSFHFLAVGALALAGLGRRDGLHAALPGGHRHTGVCISVADHQSSGGTSKVKCLKVDLLRRSILRAIYFQLDLLSNPGMTRSTFRTICFPHDLLSERSTFLINACAAKDPQAGLLLKTSR